MTAHSKTQKKSVTEERKRMRSAAGGQAAGKMVQTEEKSMMVQGERTEQNILFEGNK